MVKKILGYLVSLVGLVGVTLFTFPEQIPISLPFEAPPGAIIGVSLVLVLLGLFLVITGSKGRGKQAPEVPIFQGKNVVGYRRH